MLVHENHGCMPRLKTNWVCSVPCDCVNASQDACNRIKHIQSYMYKYIYKDTYTRFFYVWTCTCTKTQI